MSLSNRILAALQIQPFQLFENWGLAHNFQKNTADISILKVYFFWKEFIFSVKLYYQID